MTPRPHVPEDPLEGWDRPPLPGDVWVAGVTEHQPRGSEVVEDASEETAAAGLELAQVLTARVAEMDRALDEVMMAPAERRRREEVRRQTAEAASAVRFAANMIANTERRLDGLAGRPYLRQLEAADAAVAAEEAAFAPLPADATVAARYRWTRQADEFAAARRVLQFGPDDVGDGYYHVPGTATEAMWVAGARLLPGRPDHFSGRGGMAQTRARIEEDEAEVARYRAQLADLRRRFSVA